MVSQGMHILPGNSGLVRPEAGERDALGTFGPGRASPMGCLWDISKGGTDLRVAASWRQGSPQPGPPMSNPEESGPS